MISPIAISTVHGKNLAVMLASIREYCPEIPVYLRGPASVLDRFDADVKMIGAPSNFGDNYNEIINRVLQDFDSVVVANDDIVLTPTSYKVLLDDVDIISDLSLNPGWVAARCDSARAVQNIRWNPEGEAIDMCRFTSESKIRRADVISPIFAWINSEAFGSSPFPPLNWYSDDVQCSDLEALGYENFVSASYVHHVGSQTVGVDANALTNQALPWLMKHRPKYVQQWFNS
ncbi:hypothetical protein UFOVP189_17 [uncultured Caudovirales phage]|uniref:Uncharacterized protein n=1 Tax=uncultured Caudovirales phage TaxID=2100421 RepID=A0A6J7WFS9_9CAUD|nr:hypothetical protein UFOVP189_17 [uncultured Caudovirales phage]